MAVNGLSAIDSSQYMQLLLAQIQNQNPLEPVSGEGFVQQLTSLNMLQSITELNASFSEILKLQQLSEGTSLIGKKVNYEQAGTTVPGSGVVSSVQVDNGAILLQIGNATVGLDQIRSIEAAP